MEKLTDTGDYNWIVMQQYPFRLFMGFIFGDWLVNHQFIAEA